MKFLLLFIFCSNSFASLPEMFGASSSTSSLANQFSNNTADPSNNYYAPAFTAFSRSVAFNYTISQVNPNLNPINGVTTQNTVTRGTTLTGDISTDYSTINFHNIHFTLPILKPDGGKIAVSVFAPAGHLIEANSGDPYLTEYVMYRSRYNRLQAFFNYAHPITDNTAISIGAFTGFQTKANIFTRASMNGDDNGAWGRVKAKVKPSLAVIASLAQKFPWANLYLTYQQEMKSNVDAEAIGETSNPLLPFDIEINSMAYYDPHTVRFGLGTNFDLVNFITSFEYQLWDNYKTPVVRIKQKSGAIQASDDYEQVKTKNIFIPKVAIQLNATDALAFSLGSALKPSPIEGSFSGSGNSVDTDSIIYSGGLNYKTDWFEKKWDFSLAIQYHQLEDKTVVKTTNQEDGSAGSKIGSPGYTIGGNILAASFGLSLLF